MHLPIFIPVLNQTHQAVVAAKARWNTLESKTRPACYHPLLKSFRAGPWCKLPAMWVAASQPGFAHVLFLDSDAAVVGNTSVEDFFVDGHRNVLFGTAVSRAPLVFFSNRPWGLKSPCAGVFLAQPHAGAAADMLRDWWDFPAPDRDFSHAFEQDALWRSLALNTTQYNNRLAPDKISVIDEFAFLDASTSDPPRWVRHWTGPDQHRREKLMRPFNPCGRV